MDDTTFTPGEWRFVNGPPVVIERDEHHYCARTVYADDGRAARILPYTLADARLMAAAKDLYAVCKMALDWFEINSVADVTAEELRAALAKARGE